MLQINSVYFLTFTLAVLPFISTGSAQEQKLLHDLQGRTTVALTWHFVASYIHRHPSWRLPEKSFTWTDVCEVQQLPLPDGIKQLDLLFPAPSCRTTGLTPVFSYPDCQHPSICHWAPFSFSVEISLCSRAHSTQPTHIPQTPGLFPTLHPTLHNSYTFLPHNLWQSLS